MKISQINEILDNIFKDKDYKTIIINLHNYTLLFFKCHLKVSEN